MNRREFLTTASGLAALPILGQIPPPKISKADYRYVYSRLFILDNPHHKLPYDIKPVACRDAGGNLCFTGKPEDLEGLSDFVRKHIGKDIEIREQIFYGNTLHHETYWRVKVSATLHEWTVAPISKRNFRLTIYPEEKRVVKGTMSSTPTPEDSEMTVLMTAGIKES